MTAYESMLKLAVAFDYIPGQAGDNCDRIVGVKVGASQVQRPLLRILCFEAHSLHQGYLKAVRNGGDPSDALAKDIPREEKIYRLEEFRRRPCAYMWNPDEDEPSHSATNLFYAFTTGKSFAFVENEKLTSRTQEINKETKVNLFHNGRLDRDLAKLVYKRKAICYDLARLCDYEIFMRYFVVPLFRLLGAPGPSPDTRHPVSFDRIVHAEKGFLQQIHRLAPSGVVEYWDDTKAAVVRPIEKYITEIMSSPQMFLILQQQSRGTARRGNPPRDDGPGTRRRSPNPQRTEERDDEPKSKAQRRNANRKTAAAKKDDEIAEFKRQVKAGGNQRRRSRSRSPSRKRSRPDNRRPDDKKDDKKKDSNVRVPEHLRKGCCVGELAAGKAPCYNFAGGKCSACQAGGSHVITTKAGKDLTVHHLCPYKLNNGKVCNQPHSWAVHHKDVRE